LTNATTGSERIVPGQEPPAQERRPRLARLARPAVTHWQFSGVLLAAIAVRVVVILGYPPIFWFNDSYNYLYDAVTHVPDAVRPNGYPFLLDLLLPLHSAYPVAVLQAAMGLVTGVAIYALLRRRGLPWWGAALAALPVLFDSYELHVEHMVTADTLFIFLATIAVVILCWSERPSVLAMAVAGLFIGYATVVRSVGEPLLIVALVAMLARRVGWRRLATLAVAGVVPIGAYMIWFHHADGNYALTESSGTFLYSRVSTFAECAKINPPASLQVLCDPTPPNLRPPSGEYVWTNNELGPDASKTTPLYNKTGSTDTSLRFTPLINSLAGQFAKDAIFAQPSDYLRAVTRDTLHTFGWKRQPDPENYAGNGPLFRFVSRSSELTGLIPWWAGPDVPAHLPEWDAKYKNDASADQIYAARQDFGGPGLANTRVVQPWARLILIYQRYVYLRGPLLGIIVLIGAAGVVARWRRWGGVGLLPWLVGALLIVLPPMTAGFSYRYVLAAVPAACLASGLAALPRGDDPPRPPRDRGDPPPRTPLGTPLGSVRSLAADLRRHFGRGVRVDQE
jgi:hypothetical protein